jgi:hypothetical protein
LSISYITQLGHKDTRALLTIPKSIFPDFADLSNWLHQKPVALQDFSLAVSLDMPTQILGLESTTHPIAMDFDGCQAQVTLNRQPYVCHNTTHHNHFQYHNATQHSITQLNFSSQKDKNLNVDFQLLIKQKDGGKARGWVETIDGKPAAAMVCMYPTFERQITPEIIFLVDRSGIDFFLSFP